MWKKKHRNEHEQTNDGNENNDDDDKINEWQKWIETEEKKILLTKHDFTN